MNYKPVTTLDVLLSLVYQENHEESNKQEEELLQEEEAIDMEGDFVNVRIKPVSFKDPETGEIRQISITQELLEAAMKYFLYTDKEVIRKKLLEQLNDRLSNQ